MEKVFTDFNKLSKLGDKGEIKVATLLAEFGYSRIQHIDELIELGEVHEDGEALKREHYDIRAIHPDGYYEYIEVKNQDRCHEFGTVNIEQVQYGKLGGIGVSKADTYIFVNDELGFGFTPACCLKKIHRRLAAANLRKKNYQDRDEIFGVKLWITSFENWACGWKMDINHLDWVKQ